MPGNSCFFQIIFLALKFSDILISSLKFNTSAINYIRPPTNAVEDRYCFHHLSCHRSFSKIMITIKERSFAVSQMGVPTTTRVLNASDFDWDWLKFLNEPNQFGSNFRTFKSSRVFFPAKNHTRSRSPQKRGQSSLANHLTSNESGYFPTRVLPHVCCASMLGVLQHRLTFGQSDVHPTCRACFRPRHRSLGCLAFRVLCRVLGF